MKLERLSTQKQEIIDKETRPKDDEESRKYFSTLKPFKREF